MPNTSSAVFTTQLMTTGGVTLFGVATGLQPELLIAGAVGGWWAMSYQGLLSLWTRIKRIFVSAMVGAWSAPIIVYLISEKLVTIPHAASLPVALGVGLLTIDVLGTGLSGVASRFLKKSEKEIEK